MNCERACPRRAFGPNQIEIEPIAPPPRFWAMPANFIMLRMANIEF